MLLQAALQNYALRAIPSASLPPTHEAVGGYGFANHFSALLPSQHDFSIDILSSLYLHILRQTRCHVTPSCCT